MKIFKRSLFILVGFILLLALAIQFMLIYKSKEVLQQIVLRASNEQYRMEADKVSLYFRNPGIKASKVQLIPVNKAPGQSTLSFEKLDIRLNSLYSLLFLKSLEILKIELVKPEIIIYAKAATGTRKQGIAESIQGIQASLLQSIEVMNVKDVNITDASLKIYTADTVANHYMAINHIHLHLTDIYLDQQSGNTGKGLNMQGELILKNPTIHLPDSNVSVSVGHLTANVGQKSLEIDALDLSIRNEKSRPQHIKLSNLSINHLFWQRFLKEGVIELDTLFVKKGAADIYLLENKPGAKKIHSDSSRKYAGSTIEVHHIFILDLDYKLQRNIQSLLGNNIISLMVEGDSLYLQDFSLVNGRDPAFNIENMEVLFRNFKRVDLRKNAHVTMRALTIDKNSLVLKDYLLESSKSKVENNYFRIKVPEFRLNDYDLEEVLQKKLSARSIQLINPEIVLDIRQDKKDGPKKELDKVFEGLMQDISDKVQLEKIEIQNGSITILPKRSSNDSIRVSGLSMVLDAAKFPEVSNVHDFINAIEYLGSEGFVLKGKNMELEISNMALQQIPRGIYFGSIKGNFGKGKNIDLRGVTVLINDSISNYKTKGNFHASAIYAESGTVSLELIKKTDKPKKDGSSPIIWVDTLNFKNVAFSLQQGKTTGISEALNLQASQLVFRDQGLYWESLGLQATSSSANVGNTRFNAGNMRLTQPGILHIGQSSGNISSAYSSIEFSAPALDISLGLYSTKWPSLKIDSVELTKPNLNIHLRKNEHPDKVSNKTGKALDEQIVLKKLKITEPVINLTFSDKDNKMTNEHKVYAGAFVLEDINTLFPPEIYIGKFSYNTTDPKSVFKGLDFNPASLDVSLSKLRYNTIQKDFSFHIDTIQLGRIEHTIFGKKEDTLRMSVGHVGIGNVDYAKGDSITLDRLLYNTNWWVNGVELSYHTPAKTMTARNLHAAGNLRISLGLDSFAILNQWSRDSVWNTSAYEKTYDQITGGKLSVSDLKLTLENKKPRIEIARIVSDNLHFTTAKDKTKLEDTIDYRPLLTQTFTRIPLALKIDSFLLNHARVDVHEISKTTGKETHIFFSEVDSYLKNVKTWDIRENDTLELRARARFYGTDLIGLHFKQSYDDTLQGFWMRARMRHFNLPEMNQLLTPLMGIAIKSGTIDSLLLVANGNDFFAYGSMDLRYHNLRARILKTEDTKGKFLIGIENFLADLILPKHNHKRSHLLFKERLRKRSIFNFWAKISLEGLLTNLGIGSDKKERKRFESSLQKFKLPATYWEDIDGFNP